MECYCGTDCCASCGEKDCGGSDPEIILYKKRTSD